MPREKLRALQLKKFKKIVQWAYAHSCFHRLGRIESFTCSPPKMKERRFCESGKGFGKSHDV